MKIAMKITTPAARRYKRRAPYDGNHEEKEIGFETHQENKSRVLLSDHGENCIML